MRLKDLVSVKSSHVQSVGWSDKRRLLLIKFHNSPMVYQYKNVSKTTYTRMLKKGISVGEYYHRNIHNRYPYRKVNSNANRIDEW